MSKKQPQYKNKWTCWRCNYKNDVNRDCCKICGTFMHKNNITSIERIAYNNCAIRRILK